MSAPDCKRPVVHLVGAGPGDPELLTVKAVRAIRRASVLLVDDLVGTGVLRYARRSARIVHVGKRGGCKSTPQAFIERLMASEALRGERVVRLKGGDPFVFGRGGEEAAHLRALGLEVEIVSGVSAGFAAAAAAGVPLTHRDHAHGVLFITGHSRRRDGVARSESEADASTEASTDEGPDWAAIAAAAAQGITLVIYMGIATAQSLQAGLLEGLVGATPVAIVQHASLPNERRTICRLDALAATIARERLGSPAVIIVGAVVGARAELGRLVAHSIDAQRVA